MNRPDWNACHAAVFAALASTLCSTSYAADSAVDAGSLLRQSEQELNLKKSAPLVPVPAPSAPAAKPSADEATVKVYGFRFVGNTLLDTATLNRLLSPFLDRSLTLSQLREAADKVMSAYRAAGWTVRAYLPRQEIDNGMVTIHIVEARFGGAQIQGTPPTRIDAERLIAMAEANLVKGDPLHAEAVDRTLLLLNDLPGISVGGNLVPGTQEGETNLALDAVDGAGFAGSIALDNQGSRATGEERLSTTLAINSPARFGDALVLNGFKSHGIDYLRAGYTVPVGYHGWRMGVHASNLTYRVVLAASDGSVGPHGSAKTAGLDLSYPLYRGQMQNLNVVLGYDDKRFENTDATSNGSSSAYAMKVYTVALNGNRIDSWGGGGGTSAGLILTNGYNDRLNSRYAKLNLNLSRLQNLTRDLSLYAALSTQTANRNLDSSEKLYLGGFSSVRAFPSSEGGGSDGALATLELRQSLLHDWSLTGFYDYGRIKVNHDNAIASPANPNSYQLDGYGVAIAWRPLPGMEIKCTVARRSGKNPAAQSEGTDADGTKKINRVWLSVSAAF